MLVVEACDWVLSRTFSPHLRPILYFISVVCSSINMQKLYVKMKKDKSALFTYFKIKRLYCGMVYISSQIQQLCRMYADILIFYVGLLPIIAINIKILEVSKYIT